LTAVITCPTWVPPWAAGLLPGIQVSSTAPLVLPAGAERFRIRKQSGPDVAEPRAVLAGVVSAEQELTTGAEQRQDLRLRAATVTAVLRGEHGLQDGPGCGHLVTLL
jgi:hypothetical protein